MPQRTAIYLLVMLVPVLALFVLNALQIAPSTELKAALATFTAAGGAALGHGFAKDAIAIAKAKKRSKARIAASESAATMRAERPQLSPEEST